MPLKLAIAIPFILLLVAFFLDSNNRISYEDHISFYERPNQKTYNIIIPIKNKSIKNISIFKIVASCGCTKIEYPKTIYPFSTKNIVATISIDHVDMSKKIHLLGYLKTGQNINIQLNYIPAYSIANKPDIINIGHYKASDFPIKIESLLGHSVANKSISIGNQDELAKLGYNLSIIRNKEDLYLSGTCNDKKIRGDLCVSLNLCDSISNIEYGNVLLAIHISSSLINVMPSIPVLINTNSSLQIIKYNKNTKIKQIESPNDITIKQVSKNELYETYDISINEKTKNYTNAKTQFLKILANDEIYRIQILKPINSLKNHKTISY